MPEITLQQLAEVLKQRAARKGYKPGSKQYLSYVFGTLARERKRQLAQANKKRSAQRRCE